MKRFALRVVQTLIENKLKQIAFARCFRDLFLAFSLELIPQTLFQKLNMVSLQPLAHSEP